MPVASLQQQEAGWQTLAPGLILPPDIAGAAIPWSQESYANGQGTDNSLNAMHPMAAMNVPGSIYQRPPAFNPSLNARGQMWSQIPATAIEQQLPFDQTAFLATPVDEQAQVNQPTVPQRAKAQLLCDRPGCNKTFGRSSDLTRHITTKHDFRGAYKCSFPGCLKRFDRADNRQSHVKNVHKSDVPARS
ncbi:uncharacterized protein N7503_007755 [Penicillium pulvis]|uniref:uncharacterized protein n=1 Tax=Penicillium pulvis TaxID=1562058 RepID=UPI0025483FB3|nr:uncharacterized protein N7503_007755 [Penicillium pulvis]KAJ5798459.1 hypothetical protein N7503_007755 [Penicillium pulvis]